MAYVHAPVVSPTRPLTLAAPAAWQAPDGAFIELVCAFRATGGLATGDEIAARMARAGAGGLATLGRRIAQGHVLAFPWNGEYWLPWFQFDRASMQVRPIAAAILAELSGVLDAWDLTQWIVTPDSALGGRSPLQMLDRPAAVLPAARLARFLARG